MLLDLAQLIPSEFGLWSPPVQALTLFCSTFVLEDVAAVGAGVLLATGVLTWPMAFGACFLGIWMGDAGLYAIARVVGRNWFERTPLRRFTRGVERSERWFAQRGNSILIFSRLLPGARLPIYLAAGFLRVPLNRFLFITGSASFAWTLCILLATQILGAKLLNWLAPLQRTGWLLLTTIAFGFGALHLARKLATPRRLKILAASVGRWMHWEFWPAWIFYLPVAGYYLWLTLKYRSPLVPTAANPCIFAGGFVGESKVSTLRALMSTSPEFTAEAELLTGSNAEQRLVSLREICERRRIGYPLILKPDVGQRGTGVKLIGNEAQAVAYLNRTAAALIVQRYAEGPREVGIFYYRLPHKQQGHVLSMTEKLFPHITGDGESTIAELVWNDPRARYMALRYLHRLQGRESEILPTGETLKLVEAGNHAQGCIFRNGMHLCTEALADRIDAISCKLDGFYVGRYDIRYGSEDDLRAGRNFQIVELNGAASEATSIYDARNSLLAAYRTLFRQWELVFAIGAANRKDGCAPTNLPVLWRAWREYSRHAATYPAAD
jgi:membrane protein DedA with SNARE-associated domain